MSFEFKRLSIPDVYLIKPNSFPDRRGFFRELYKMSEFAANGLPTVFAQDNLSHSVRDVLRGLHYQKPPHEQGKLVSVMRGTIFDVAVDIRKGSPWYAKFVGQILSADDASMMYVPPGFAHGFLVLSEEADVIYKVTAEFEPQSARSISWNDPDLGIAWPTNNPILSSADSEQHLFRYIENDFEYERRQQWVVDASRIQ